MRRYTKKEITEKELEDKIRQAPDQIESGLSFLTIDFHAIFPDLRYP